MGLFKPRQISPVLAVMAKVIISYRRADSTAVAGRIRDRLAGQYGASRVFMDVEDIPFGSDFREHIRNELLNSDLLLVIVGREWLGKAGDGTPRILSETDPVRIEVETALQNAIPVIPVLVNGAQVPEPSDLPETLTKLAFLNAATVDAGRDFHVHMERLILGIDAVAAARRKAAAASAQARSRTQQPRLLAAAAALAAIMIAGGGWWFLTSRPAATRYAVASADEVAADTGSVAAPRTRSIAAPSQAGPSPAQQAPRTRSIAPPSEDAPQPVQPERVALTTAPEVAPSPSTASAIAGTYLAQANTGCGASRQSVRVVIGDGRISWQHDAFDTTFRWEGTIAADGTIKAAVADRPNLAASGHYSPDEREVAMTYPQCGPVTMVIVQMLSR
jgi:hypothetical protein